MLLLVEIVIWFVTGVLYAEYAVVSIGAFWNVLYGDGAHISVLCLICLFGVLFSVVVVGDVIDLLLSSILKTEIHLYFVYSIV